MIRLLGPGLRTACSVPAWQSLLHAATASTAAEGTASAGQLDPGIIVVPMPSLSHAMASGKVKRWLKQVGFGRMGDRFDYMSSAKPQEGLNIVQ